MEDERRCQTCFGTGEAASEHGIMDCPDCGGGGELPERSVRVEWRARDIERALARGTLPDIGDVRWLAAELRAARTALTEVIALAHDTRDPDGIAGRIRFVANRALNLYDVDRGGS